MNASITASAKRYRYTGKERDEETGLYYHGARYYACWLGRWTASDPIGISGGSNLYEYAASSPAMLSDPRGTAPEPAPSALTMSDVQAQQSKVEQTKNDAIARGAQQVTAAQIEINGATAAYAAGPSVATEQGLQLATASLLAASDRLQYAQTQGYLPGDTLGALNARVLAGMEDLVAEETKRAGKFDSRGFEFRLAADAAAEIVIGAAEEFTPYGDVVAAQEAVEQIAAGVAPWAAIVGGVIRIAAGRRVDEAMDGALDVGRRPRTRIEADTKVARTQRRDGQANVDRATVGAAGGGAKAFKAPRTFTNRHGELTNGAYTLDKAGMAPHTTGSLSAGKSQFLHRLNERQLTLDAAAYADDAGLWVGNKAKVVLDNYIGVHAGTGLRTKVVNVYRTKTGHVHAAPGTPR